MKSPETSAPPTSQPRESHALSRFGQTIKVWWPLLAVGALLIGAFFIRLHYYWGHAEYTTDSYYYMLLARSIRSGLGYTVRGAAHIKYLPGYPLMIALFSFLFRDVSRAAGYLAILGGTFSVLFTYLLGRELLGKVAGVLGAAVLAFQPAFLQWTSLPMTEGIFTLCFVASLYLWLTGCRRGSSYRRLGAAALVGFTLLVRWEGLLLLPLMLLIVLLYWKDARIALWETAVVLFLCVAPIGVFLGRNLIATGKVTAYVTEYASQESGLSWERLWTNLVQYSWRSMLDGVMMLLFYIGAVIALVRRYKAFLILFGWFLLFVIFHIFWHYSYERFMVPAIPAMALFVGYLFSSGIDLVMGVRGARDGPWRERYPRLARMPAGVTKGLSVAVICAGLLVIACGFTAVMHREVTRAQDIVNAHRKALMDDNGGRAVPKAAEWLRQNVERGEKVATDIGPYLYYEYGEPVLYLRPIPFDIPVEDPDFEPPELLDKLTSADVKYLVIGHVPEWQDVSLMLPREIPPGLVIEMADLGFTQEEVDRLDVAVLWEEEYDFPAPHQTVLAIFEVRP